MITKIWIKGKTKSKDVILHQDCYPRFNFARPKVHEDFIHVVDINDKLCGAYFTDKVARVEFRP